MAKQAKMILCASCSQEISAKAKKCPHCGCPVKKPVYKKWWFWLIIAIVLIASVGGGSGSGGSSENKKVGEVSQPLEAESRTEEVSEAEEIVEEEPPVQTVYKVGDILHDGNMDIVYIAAGDYKEENEFLQPEDGKKYVFLKFAFINTSDKSDSSVSSLEFECYADGYSCDQHYEMDNDLSATLSPGRATEGYVYFEVPEEAKEIEVEYTTNYFTEDKITFVVDGNQDSGYVLEKNTEAAEDAVAAGAELEGDGLKITYLRCFEDESDNMFLQPKSGYRYITCEFEFENTSKSDKTVSSFSFDAYADGVACDDAYLRDDVLSATISAGRKAKGTVTYEVPKDAKVFEVEYLDNFWTSKRLVFNALP